MKRRMLLIDLAPGDHSSGPRIPPLILMPMGDGRAAVALDDLSAEEALAELLARGVAVRASRVVVS